MIKYFFAALLLIVISPCKYCISAKSGQKKTVSVICKEKDPGIMFAISDLEKAFSERNIAVKQTMVKGAMFTVNCLTTTGNESSEKVSEGFSISKDGSGNILITGGGRAGTMYGIMELAEQVKLYGPQGVRTTEQNPYMEVRGIKFNIPLDVRTPSYSDMSDAGQQNIPVMWSMDFWKETIDNLARSRYNLISLWSLHPFPSMVKVPEYPEIALDDVKRHKGSFDENYSTRATGYDTPEIMENTETLIGISIDDKIKFWRAVMRYAKERNIRFYVVTWNIYTYGIGGKYGIDDRMDNRVTRDYYRQSVKQMFLTYPDLAGIGITTGENMGGGGERFEEKEDWIYDTYAAGMLDVIKVQPDRKITFIHRAHEAGTAYVLDKFSGIIQNRNIEFLHSYKYAQAHVFSSDRQARHLTFVKDIAGMKTLWTLRNDDNYYFRWGAPGFVRNFIKNIPHDVSRGFYYGSDNYIWGKDFLSLENNSQTETGRHWYHWMLWGRLGYDPGVSDTTFIAMLRHRYPGTDAGKLFAAWQEASMIYPVTTGFHWGDLDYKWYIEGCKSRPEPAQTESGFHDVNRFISLPPHSQSGYQSIPDFVSGKLPSATLKTPRQVAEMLNNHSDVALRLAGEITPAGNSELEALLNDIRAMAFLGKYYASKILGATELAFFRSSGDPKNKTESVLNLEMALRFWNLYTSTAMKQYRNPLWTNRVGYVDWIKLTEEVKRDIDIARQGK